MATLNKEELQTLWNEEKDALMSALLTPLYQESLDELTQAQIIDISAKVQGLDEFADMVKANMLSKKNPTIETDELLHLYVKARNNYIHTLYKTCGVEYNAFEEKKAAILIASGKLKVIKSFRDRVKTYLQSKS